MATKPQDRVPLRARNRCIFCGRSPTNREHIFSHWMHRHIQKPQKKWNKYVSVGYLDRTDAKTIKRPGDPHDHQVKCVCEKNCNNGWMRAIENRAKPIIVPLLTGNYARLTPVEQSILVSWVAIKATVLEFDAGATVISSSRQRRRLMDQREPPHRTWRIWIGRYNGTELREAVCGFAMSFKKIPENPVTTYNSQILTYVVGELLIHVVRLPYKVLREVHFPPTISGKLRQIWPRSDYSFRWPPIALTDREASIVQRGLHYRLTAAAKRRLSQ